jgi:NADPH:quinone reductase-like Zn-dependent oxidoreductase
VKEDRIGHRLLHAGVVAVPSYGVCSTRNVDMVGSLGADRVIDYAQEDFTRTDRRYDLMLDVAGSRSWSACRRVLNPQATLVLVGAPRATV